MGKCKATMSPMRVAGKTFWSSLQSLLTADSCIKLCVYRPNFYIAYMQFELFCFLQHQDCMLHYYYLFHELMYSQILLFSLKGVLLPFHMICLKVNEVFTFLQFFGYIKHLLCYRRLLIADPFKKCMRLDLES